MTTVQTGELILQEESDRLKSNMVSIELYAEACRSGLTDKQCNALDNARDGMPLRQAAIQAGYTPSNASAIWKQGTRLRDTLEIYRRLQGLQKGVDIAEKRLMLLQLIGVTGDPDNKGYSPTACVAAIKQLSLLDGDVQTGSLHVNAPTQIIMNNIAPHLQFDNYQALLDASGEGE